MLQTVDGREVYVVEFDTMPELPITWMTQEEEPYARALAAAIHNKVVTEPGKYGVHIDHDADGKFYKIYRIEE